MTHFKHSIRLACTLALASLLPLGAGAQAAAPASSTQTDKGTQQMSNPHPRVKLETNLGDLVLTLDAEKAPKTTENFLTYVKEGFYDGTIFHRVIDGFMIQGGGFDKDMRQKPTQAPIKNEAANGLKNDVYTIAMARTSDPNSASAQFFINVKDNDFLNYSAPTVQGFGYAVFGKVVEGQDVVENIAKLPAGNRGM